jgi:uncharacterized protein YndB with AHSA1/START domain
LTDIDTADVYLRRTYSYPPEAVFDAFSSSVALEGWLAPSADIPARVELFDFRVGGAFRMTFLLLDGQELVLGGRYLTIEQPRSLSFTWLWESPDVHAGVHFRSREPG